SGPRTGCRSCCAASPGRVWPRPPSKHQRIERRAVALSHHTGLGPYAGGVTTPPYETPTTAEIDVVSRQLGRAARGVVGIAARCVCGNPTVVATAPRLDDGTPFPTFYYLTHPAATAAMSTLEATQVMPELAQLLEDDP